MKKIIVAALVVGVITSAAWAGMKCSGCNGTGWASGNGGQKCVQCKGTGGNAEY